jgi:DNA invertase Pin-like site-specific DNA recombinase
MTNDWNTKNPSVRCAIYLRSACIEQGTDPLNDQKLSCQAAAALHPDWTILDDHVYRDAGVSGYSHLGRTGLRSLLEDVKSLPRPFDCIIVAETARVGRNPSDVAEILDQLACHGVYVYFANQGLDSRHADFQPVLSVMESFNGGKCAANHSGSRPANAELPRGARSIYARFSGGISIEEQRRNCREAAQPIGYRSARQEVPASDVARGPGTSGSQLEIVESEAEAVRHIYEMYAGGMSVHEILKILNIEMVPAARRPQAGSARGSWNRNLVSHVLQNERYIGTMVWNRTKAAPGP